MSNNIFNNKTAWKIIVLFLQNDNQPVHGREIARFLRQNQKTIQTALHLLEKKKVLLRQEAGKNYLYKINCANKNVLYYLITAEDHRTVDFLEQHFEMKEIAADLRSTTEEPILIFGSQAKGYPTKKSDLDLLILDKTIKDVNSIQPKYIQKLHFITMTKNAFSQSLIQKKSFPEEVLKSHYIIQGFDFFAKRWITKHG